MPATQTVNAPSFESVWAIMQDNAVQMKKFRENQKETERQIQDNAVQMKEFRESQKETERVLKESKKALDIQIGSLTNLFGDFTLGMIAPRIREKFTELGLVFLESSLNFDVTDRINNISFEIDIFLKNGEKAMLVEVKTKLTEERINKHINRLEKMRRYADLHGDKRVFLGAVAGFAVTDEVRKIALDRGFYLIEPDGENFNITPPNDKPKEW
ncbi:MAG: hypothetical protein FWG99_07465 [Treponema sp.]|nr:hypothetical protein [Treponema sp.]